MASYVQSISGSVDITDFDTDARNGAITASTSPPTASVRGDPWLEDGNVILRADNIDFRVFKSILSNSSLVFRDMFAVAQPHHIDDASECPVVVMHDDPIELGYLLKAVFIHS